MKKNNLARGEQVRMRNGSESVTESLQYEAIQGSIVPTLDILGTIESYYHLESICYDFRA